MTDRIGFEFFYKGKYWRVVAADDAIGEHAPYWWCENISGERVSFPDVILAYQQYIRDTAGVTPPDTAETAAADVSGAVASEVPLSIREMGAEIEYQRKRAEQAETEREGAATALKAVCDYLSHKQSVQNNWLPHDEQVVLRDVRKAIDNIYAAGNKVADESAVYGVAYRHEHYVVIHPNGGEHDFWDAENMLRWLGKAKYIPAD